MSSSIVLIGPPGVGKSTIGPLLADLLSRPFVDLDEFGPAVYDRIGMGLDRLADQIATHGFVAAHRWWQPARVGAVRVALERRTGSVVGLGAGHSHFEDREFANAVAAVLAPATVVLLRIAADPVRSSDVLRERCRRTKHTDWSDGDVDLLDEWVRSEQNLALADLVVDTDTRSAAEVARSLAVAVTVT